jgi:hypothetical protein
MDSKTTDKKYKPGDDIINCALNHYSVDLWLLLAFFHNPLTLIALMIIPTPFSVKLKRLSIMKRYLKGFNRGLNLINNFIFFCGFCAADDVIISVCCLRIKGVKYFVKGKPQTT